MTNEQAPEPLFRPSSWLADGPLDGQRLAWHRLSASLRQINEALMDMDATEADLLAAAERAEIFAANLETTRKGRQHWGFAESSVAGTPRGMLDRSPIIGLGNPVAPPLTFAVEGDHVVGRGSFGLQYEGPPGCVHGGFVAAAFDEVLGMAQSLTGTPGMTGTMTVRYRKPTPLYADLRFEGWVDRVEGRKIFTLGRALHDDELTAEADAVFITVDFSKIADLYDRRRRPH